MIRAIFLLLFAAAGLGAEVKTGEVSRGEFRIDVELAGLFVGTEEPVALRPEAWKEWVIVSLVEHGTVVKKGDELIRFDTRAITRSLAEWEAHIISVEAALARAKLNLAQLKTLQPITLNEARRKQEAAEFSAADFAKKGREFRQKTAQNRVLDSENYLAYAREELRQLEKMYTNDQLVGETEEIVLKRQRDSVARSEFAVESARRSLDFEEGHGIQAEAEAVQQRALRAKHERAGADAAAALAIQEHEFAIAKAENEVAKARATLADYRADHEAMVLRSPQDGLVYYGRFFRGAWDRPGVETFLFPGGKALPHKTLMTVVATDALTVYGHLPVRLLEHVRPGVEGRVAPNGLSQFSLPARVTGVSATPVLQDWWAAEIAVELPEDRGAIVPGLTCKFRFTPHYEKEALRAPLAGVFTEASAPDTHYVFVVSDVGEERRTVTVGRRNDKWAVITEGLQAGDKIRLEHP
jgi:HlyD family secretion protein